MDKDYKTTENLFDPVHIADKAFNIQDRTQTDLFHCELCNSRTFKRIFKKLLNLATDNKNDSEMYDLLNGRVMASTGLNLDQIKSWTGTDYDKIAMNSSFIYNQTIADQNYNIIRRMGPCPLLTS